MIQFLPCLSKSLTTIKKFFLLPILLFNAVLFAQTNPAPFNLAGGNFSFSTQTVTSTTYPTNIQGWNNGGTVNVTLLPTVASTADISLTQSATVTTAAIGNLGTNGFQFLTSGTIQTVGAICLSLNTTGRVSEQVTWTAADQTIGTTRQMNLTLQYRLGITGSFTTVAASTYTTSNTAIAAAQTFTNVVLPSACDNQAIVQLRWIYYESAAQAGARDAIRLDDISVTSSLLAPTINGTITAGEYGTHVNGVNQQNNGAATTFMNWDATNLYIAVDGSTVGESFVLYLDRNSLVPINSGTNANGTNIGFNYDNTSFAELPFRADLVLYVKNNYREYRTADGSNGWSAPTAAFGSYADNGTTIREFAIPWSSIGGIPASFNFYNYVTSAGGFVYAQTPTENAGGTIGTSARYSRYYTVSLTTSGSVTPPFSRNSYVFNSASDANAFGIISAYDFTMNTAGKFISRSGNVGGNWSINGNLVMGAGTIYLGSGGSGYGTTNIFGNMNLLGGTFDMDATTAPVNLAGATSSLSIASGATLKLSSQIGGDFNLLGNWSNLGTFTPSGRAVTFNGTTAQTMTGATSFDFLTLNNPTGLTLFNPATVNNILTLTSGKISLGAYDLTIGSAGSIVSSTTNYVVVNSTGSLIKNAVGNTAFTFPIGLNITQYTPIALTNTVGTSNLTVNLKNTITNAVTDPARIVNLEWNVTSSAATTATVTPTWVMANNGSSFTSTGAGEIGDYTTAYTTYPTTLATTTTTATGVTLATGSNKIVVGNTSAVYAAPPANDNCTGAIALTVDAAPITGNVTGATQSIASAPCAGTANDDVWYSFTTGVAGNYNITAVGSTSFDAVLDLRSGACNGTNLLCKDASAATGTEIINGIGLAAATTYYVRVYDFFPTIPATRTFTIAVSFIAPPTITSFAASGCVGTSVVVTGTNLSGVSSVKIGGTTATFSANTATSVTFTVPTTASGTIVIIAATGTATSATNFTINPLPTTTWASTAIAVCPSVSAQTTTLAYTATTNAPVTYSIVWNATPTNSFIAVTDAPFAGTAGGGTITLNIPANANSGTYTGTITVKNANGCVSTAVQTFSVTVNGAPATGNGVTICQGGAGNLTSSFSCAPSVNNNLVLTDIPATGSPTYNRSATGTTYSATGIVSYSTINFSVTQTGSYILNGCASGDTHMQLYSGTFNPVTPTSNFLQADDDGNTTTCTSDPRITRTLTAGVNYILIMTPFSGTGSVTGITVTATPPAGGGLISGASGVVEWYANTSGGLALGTGSSFNPVGVAGSSLSNTNTAGTTTYYVACSTNSTCRTPVNFVIKPNTTIATQPVSQTVCQGTPVTLSVVGANSTFYAYQWYKNGVIVSGATNATLTFSTSLPSDTGNYTVELLGDCGPVLTSDIAILNVKTNVGITSITSSANPICASATATLTADGVVGTNAVLTWWTGSNASGANLGSTPTITVGPGTYYARVTGDCGAPQEANFTIITIAIPTYANLQFPGAATICQTENLTAYGQVYQAGVTEAAGSGTGITAEFGYNSTNTDPSTWTTWNATTFNVQVGNNDEYQYTFNPPTSGTFYYTFRYRQGTCDWLYGGYSASNGGFWNGTTIVNGQLTVNPNVTPTFTAYAPICSGDALSALPTTSTNGITGTWNPTLDNTATTTYTFTPNSGQCATSATLTISIGNTTTWVGLPTGWDNGTPTNTSTAVITSNYNSTTDGGSIVACTLTVSNNSSVVIASNNNVTLNGKLTVNTGSTFTLNNNANLLQNTNVANSGNIIVKRNSSALKRQDYTLWSSPVANQNLLAFSPATLTNRFYTYETNATPISNVYIAVPSPSTTNFAVGKGYLIRMPNTHPATATVWNGQFTGVPNNGNVPVTLTNNGVGQRFNAIGNPYPSTLDMSSFVASNRQTGDERITGTLYFWRKTNSTLTSPGYCTWNSGTFISNNESQVFNPNGILQVGQGFIVEAQDNATALSFNNTMRGANNNNQFFKNTNVVENNRIWLNMTATTGEFSQTAVNYRTDAVQTEDPFDAKYFNDGVIAFSSNINNNQYAIQSRAIPFEASDIVPLNFKVTTAGNYSIAIDHVDGLFSGGVQEIYIKDNYNGSYNNITTLAYNFASEAGTFINRFELVYQNALSTNIPSLTLNSVVIYKNNTDVVINAGNILISKVKIFDIRGRLLLEKGAINASETRMNVGEVNQVLLVQITSNDGQVVTKKIVN